MLKIIEKQKEHVCSQFWLEEKQKERITIIFSSFRQKVTYKTEEFISANN